MRRGNQRAGGYTLVELAAAVGIIALLSGVLIPVISTQVDDAKKGRAEADMDLIAKAFTKFRADTGMWPGWSEPVAGANLRPGDAALTGFGCLYSNALGLANWKGPYLDHGVTVGGRIQLATVASVSAAAAGLLDPWGQPYHLFVATPSGTRAGSMVLLSRGPDGIIESSASHVAAGAPAGDDLIKVVARRL